eukprot:scaffold1090_cov135-Isochrysis_galbana.AAC.6
MSMSMPPTKKGDVDVGRPPRLTLPLYPTTPPLPFVGERCVRCASGPECDRTPTSWPPRTSVVRPRKSWGFTGLVKNFASGSAGYYRLPTEVGACGVRGLQHIASSRC